MPSNKTAPKTKKPSSKKNGMVTKRKNYQIYNLNALDSLAKAFADQSGDENSVNIQQDGGSDRCLNESNANNVPTNDELKQLKKQSDLMARAVSGINHLKTTVKELKKDMAAQKLKHDKDISDLKEKHDKDISDLKEKHDKDISDLKKDLDAIRGEFNFIVPVCAKDQTHGRTVVTSAVAECKSNGCGFVVIHKNGTSVTGLIQNLDE